MRLGSALISKASERIRLRGASSRQPPARKSADGRRWRLITMSAGHEARTSAAPGGGAITRWIAGDDEMAVGSGGSAAPAAR